MKQFNHHDYPDDTCMHCVTEEQAERFLEYLHETGLKWSSGRSYATNTRYSSYGDQTVYYFNRGTFGRLRDVGEDNVVLHFEDFDWGDGVPEELTMSFDSIFR